ncbi:Uncharacterized conserved protein BC10 (implicated in bladder cancer in humans) [Phaffia rhodozyma]|uniref:Uncharacterized conserved protein BC10 (Implicated in bladder cancer in humans) n=1 Tax=Phaffia rhodozyma TaxID=264483 RepID=A0A0F7SFR7_PHARH|nr:Uncharacterized conserved protein BC10 (implicated in bladder cancer in humans) [Phaffia rhodozyma]
MVFCVKHFLPLILLPYPSAAPLFTVVYLVSFFLSVQPCVYCTILVSVLFTSTCYTHSSNAAVTITSTGLQALQETNETSTLTLLVYPMSFDANISRLVEPTYSTNQPDPYRSWADLNGGHLASPVLLGYKYQSRLLDSTQAVEQRLAKKRQTELEVAQKERAEKEEAARAELIASQTIIARWTSVIVERLIANIARAPLPRSWFSPPTSVSRSTDNTSTSTDSNPDSRSVVTDPFKRDLANPRWDPERKRLDARFNDIGLIFDFKWVKSFLKVLTQKLSISDMSGQEHAERGIERQ